MTQVLILNKAGKATAKADVAQELAGQEIKSHLIHETVVAELAARRAGTHSTRTRGQVRGGGSKPWRQKGTGRARAGSTRSPIWTGGGIVFGPTPRSYGGKVNRKVRRQAFLGALRAHVERHTLAVMEPTGWDEPSTKRADEYLRAAPERLGERPLLICLEDVDGVDGRSFRNLDGVDVLPAAGLETADLLAYRAVIVERASWERMAGELGASKRTTAKDSSPSAGEAADAGWEAGAKEREARAKEQAEYAEKRRAERTEEEEQAAAAAAAAAALAAAAAGTEPNADDELEAEADEPAAEDAVADDLESDTDTDTDADDDVDATETDSDESPDADDEPEPEATVEDQSDDEDAAAEISDEELEAEALAAAGEDEVDELAGEANAEADDEKESS